MALILTPRWYRVRDTHLQAIQFTDEIAQECLRNGYEGPFGWLVIRGVQGPLLVPKFSYPDNNVVAFPTDWIVKRKDGLADVLEDAVFRERFCVEDYDI